MPINNDEIGTRPDGGFSVPDQLMELLVDIQDEDWRTMSEAVWYARRSFLPGGLPADTRILQRLSTWLRAVHGLGWMKARDGAWSTVEAWLTEVGQAPLRSDMAGGPELDTTAAWSSIRERELVHPQGDTMWKLWFN